MSAAMQAISAVTWGYFDAIVHQEDASEDAAAALLFPPAEGLPQHLQLVLEVPGRSRGSMWVVRGVDGLESLGVTTCQSDP
jgi:hypothetical protein